ncbi:MAG: hypothetical protein ACSHYF_16600 [Verrucomicrobiaceae bacterium]
MSTVTTERFSVLSIIAIVSAVLTFMTGPILGLIFAAVAVLAGLGGIILAASPRVRGGLTSTLAIVGGFIGVIAAIIKAIMWLF